LNIPFRQSFSAILMSFTVTAAILGAFSPLMAFMVWNAPPMSPEGVSGPTYSFIKLAHVVAIAFSCYEWATRAVFQLLARLGWQPDRRAPGVVLRGWRSTCFSAASFPWILRPFIGSPSAAVLIFPCHGPARKFLRKCLSLTCCKFFSNLTKPKHH